MPITAQFLFGSHARQDHNADSDVDILCITNEDWQKSSSHSNINVSFYPKDHFLLSALNGDLFLLHIIRESKILYDPTGLLAVASKSFKLRSSYDSDIKHASDLGNFLINYAQKLPYQEKSQKIINKRVAWCARTILIAVNIRKGDIIFDAAGLSKKSGSTELIELLSHKESSGVFPKDFSILCRIIKQYGQDSSEKQEKYSLDDWNRLFTRTNNSIAIKTLFKLRNLSSKSSEMFYY